MSKETNDAFIGGLWIGVMIMVIIGLIGLGIYTAYQRGVLAGLQEARIEREKKP